MKPHLHFLCGLLLALFFASCENADTCCCCCAPKKSEPEKRKTHIVVSTPASNDSDTTFWLSYRDSIPDTIKGFRDHAATLQLYINRDSFEIRDPDGIEMWSRHVNNEQFGFYEPYDTLIILRGDNQQYHVVSKTHVDDTFVQQYYFKDLNMDGYADLLLIDGHCICGNAGTVFIYDPGVRNFIHRPSYDLANLEVIPSQHILRSISYSSACGALHKGIYRPDGDTLRLIESYIYWGACNSDPTYNRANLWHKINENGTIRIDSVTINADSAWNRCMRALWDTRKD